MDYNEVLETARTKIGTKCKACPICNGVACRNTMPGPGAKGIGDTAIRNYQKWQEIRVNMDTICEKKQIDTGLELFGKHFSYPFFAGPVGAIVTLLIMKSWFQPVRKMVLPLLQATAWTAVSWQRRRRLSKLLTGRVYLL